MRCHTSKGGYDASQPNGLQRGRDTVLDVARTERAKFYNIIDDPNNWYVQTRCSEWEVRDMVGHMIDVTEGYLTAWDMARKGETGNALGLPVMSDRLNEHAQAFRSLSREEAISRLKKDSDQAFVIFDALTPEEWIGAQSLIPTWALYQPASIPPFKSSTMVFTPGT